MYYLRKVTVSGVTNDKLFGYAAHILPSGAWEPSHAIDIDLEPGTPGVRPVVIKGISVAALSDARLIVVCASLQNHDGVGGANNNHGLWAKIWNIEQNSWLVSVPFNVNQVSMGNQIQSAIVALPGLKFLVAFITDSPHESVKSRLWTPTSS